MDGGENIEAKRVVSAVDPQRTFHDQVGVERLDIGSVNRIRRLRYDGPVAKLHLALNDLPLFNGLENAHGRMIIAPNMDATEFAFNHSKYRVCPSEPVVEVVIPGVHDASCAPAHATPPPDF